MVRITAVGRPVIERGVSRRDDSAAAWLAQSGLEVKRGAPLRVVADLLRSDDFEVTRLWHSAARIRRGPRGGPDIRLLVPLEGSIVVQPDDPAVEEVRLGPGEIAFLRCSDGSTLVTESPSARIEIMLGRPMLDLVDSAAPGAFVTKADGPSRGILLSTVNATFGSTLDADSAAFLLVRTAVEQLAVGVLATSLPPNAGETVYTRALALIAAMATDPRLSVHEIHERLDVPKRTLQRIFAGHGTTVFNEIRRARLTTARALLGGTEIPPGPEHALGGYVRSQRLQRDLRHLEGGSGARPHSA